MRIALAISLLFLAYNLFGTTFDARTNRLDAKSAKLRLESISSEVNLPYTYETNRLLQIYTHSYRPGARRIIERSGLYFPTFEQKLERLDLPPVLKNLGIVESNLEPWSVSKQGAVGVWQLMPNTARKHGLIMDHYVDERFDPILSSTVAFDYLRDLYTQFKDWNLAITAYNCGPVTLRKAVKHGNSYDLNIIGKYLPRESKRYISRLAAATYLTHYYEEHNIHPKRKKYHTGLASIRIYDYLTFSEISKITGLTKTEIAQYNPAVFYDFLPANERGYHLNLPVELMIRFIRIKGRSMNDIIDVHRHLERIEEILVFTIPWVFPSTFALPFEPVYGDEKEDGNGQDNHSSEEIFALRREQVLRRLSLA